MSDSLSFKAHFQEMAAYNRWANARLYADAATLTDEALHRDVGVYFQSLFATLTHLLQTDRAWTFLLQGGTLGDMALPGPPADLPVLLTARQAQDAEFVAWMDRIDTAWLAQPFTFVSGLGSWKGKSYAGTHASTLTHLFNHQTHHRGQAHTALKLLGVAEPQALDILVKGFLGA
jgi:uncharacterized damage-inducible protein DinB